MILSTMILSKDCCSFQTYFVF